MLTTASYVQLQLTSEHNDIIGLNYNDKNYTVTYVRSHVRVQQQERKYNRTITENNGRK